MHAESFRHSVIYQNNNNNKTLKIHNLSLEYSDKPLPPPSYYSSLSSHSLGALGTHLILTRLPSLLGTDFIISNYSWF